MVITQETTQPLATLHRLLTTRFRDLTEQQDVGLPLMIPLSMVMLDVFAQRSPQGALTKENALRQTLVLYRPDPPLSIGIPVRTAGRQCKRFAPAGLDDRAEREGVLRVAIMQEIATVLKRTASLHGHVPGHLLHPRLVRVDGDPGDVHLAALEVDEKQHVVGHHPA